MRRSIVYVSGTRADYGLMRRTLIRIRDSSSIELRLFATGMHLLEEHGSTIREIQEDGFDVRAISNGLEAAASHLNMAQAVGAGIVNFATALTDLKPDAAMVLGDRGEMLAAAIAAVHLNVPVVHVHGGERSGTIDELVRHAVTKLSHYHFVATEASRQRLLGMGELGDRIFVTGAPGLDGLEEDASVDKGRLFADVGFDPSMLAVLVVYHPVVQDAARMEGQMIDLLDVVCRTFQQVVCLTPNSDAGSAGIRSAIDRFGGRLRVFKHLRRFEFLSWLRAVDCMVGNSSSGIIEAATFGTPVVNVGSRQALRERNSNVIDCDLTSENIRRAIEVALERGPVPTENVYGDGQSGSRITSLLATVPLGPEVLHKINAY